MSTEQQKSISDSHSERPKWKPEADPGRRCRGCGSHISTNFARVLGDNDDQAWRCPNCSHRGELSDGAATERGDGR